METVIQFLIILGIIFVIVFAIWTLRKQPIHMKSHHKIQAIALLGLTSVAVIALAVAVIFKDAQSFAAVASAAVGGIAGFISHKETMKNKTLLFPLKDVFNAVAGAPLEFSIAGLSTAGYNLNYMMSSSPTLPDSAKFNNVTGEFSWAPIAEDKGDYDVSFTVTDGMGGSDTRTTKIKVQ